MEMAIPIIANRDFLIYYRFYSQKNNKNAFYIMRGLDISNPDDRQLLITLGKYLIIRKQPRWIQNRPKKKYISLYLQPILLCDFNRKRCIYWINCEDRHGNVAAKFHLELDDQQRFLGDDKKELRGYKKNLNLNLYV